MIRSKDVLNLASGIAGALTATIITIGVGVPFIQNLMDVRRKVVKKAIGEVGKNDAAKYWRNVLPGSSMFPNDWCGGFALWALHQAGLAPQWNWEIGKGFLWRLPTTQNPKAGDIAYFDLNQHHAIVRRINADNTVTLINGNGVGRQVTETVRPMASVRAFYSIQPLIDSQKG